MTAVSTRTFTERLRLSQATLLEGPQRPAFDATANAAQSPAKRWLREQGYRFTEPVQLGSHVES
jgi:hypothetical protein